LYNFIIKLFTDNDYQTLLEEDNIEPKTQKSKILIVPPNSDPFVINQSNIQNEIQNNNVLSQYPKDEITQYLNVKAYVNPTHNINNHIGANLALMSHSPMHIKIIKTFYTEEDENVTVNFPTKNIDKFVKLIENTEYHPEFKDYYPNIKGFLVKLNNIDKDKFKLNKNDFIVFLIPKDKMGIFQQIFTGYVSSKILKYKTFTGVGDCCSETRELYTLTQGNDFEIGKDRKFVLRHPTRYLTNLKSKSHENFNVCEKCLRQINNFFEYLIKYKFYTFIFPTRIKMTTEDYRDYSSNPKGILKMLQKIYAKNNTEEFDYIMIVTDPKIDDIEFKYISNFNFKFQENANENPFNIRDIPIYSNLKELKKGKDDKITMIYDKRDKLNFLMEINQLLFNGILSATLFKREKKDLKAHPFLKLKTIEYADILRDFIYFQDQSLFIDRLYTKMFREILSEIVENKKFFDEMFMFDNKIRFILTIYYKYLDNESNGGEIVKTYLGLSAKLKDVENLNIENDFEAGYFMGQIFYYLLQQSKTQNKLDMFTKYTMNVHDMENLKKRLIDVLEKYSHNEYIDRNKKLHNVMKSVLAHEFNSTYEDNKISMYTGYFDRNCLYGSKKEEVELEKEEKGSE
jgi:CRISPR-associated protein Csh1